MKLNSRSGLALFPFLWMISPAIAISQANPASPASPREAVGDLVARLSPKQKQQFDDAGKSFSAQHYADALAIFKELLSELPGDAILSKFASEAALNVGDTSFALSTLKPLAQADPEDWQAAGLLTRACAESGDLPCRDAGMEHMLDLHRRAITPPGMQQYIVERVKVAGNALLILVSLEPWGRYKVYAYGQVLDGHKEHPEEAAKGIRSFSMDGYSEIELNNNGQRTQTHFTIKFLVGQPSYDKVREEFVKFASRKATAPGGPANSVVP
jgi:hypothetical protein